MKKKEIQELKNKSEAELRKLVKENREKLRSLRFDLVAGKIKNAKELRGTRALIARALTFLAQPAQNK
jgi:ribosomal protein L29